MEAARVQVMARQRYSEKADVFSFGVVLWECTARATPFAGMDGVQAAMAVLNRGLRPEIPLHTPPMLAQLIRACWAPIASQRPSFKDLAVTLRQLSADYNHSG